MLESPGVPNILDDALHYARMAWPIFPIRPRGKTPAISKWQSFQPSESSLWFWHGEHGCNIGLRTGEFIVLDSDTEEAESWIHQRNIESSMLVRSGSSGLHRYFRCPEGQEIRNRQGLHRIKGLDVRGTGGYIILPPSIQPNGKRYEWLTDILPVEQLPHFDPSWLVTQCGLPTVSVETRIGNMIARARSYLACIEGAVSGNHGHNRAFRAACVLVSKFGLSFEEAWPLYREWNEQCEPPFNEKELRHKLEDALKKRDEKGGR